MYTTHKKQAYWERRFNIVGTGLDLELRSHGFNSSPVELSNPFIPCISPIDICSSFVYMKKKCEKHMDFHWTFSFWVYFQKIKLRKNRKGSLHS